MHQTLKNHKKISFFCPGLMILFFFVIAFNASSQDYNSRNFSSDDGFSQSYVYSLLQDVHGYLWIGTDNGLLRFNGFRFENFTTADSLADNFITCGITDGDNLWFGHMNAGLSFFDGKKFHKVRMPKPEVSRITHISKGPGGQIWGSTYSGSLLKLSKDSAVIQYDFPKNPPSILTFGFINENDLLIGTANGVLYGRLKKPHEIELIKTVTDIPESRISGIVRTKDKSGFYIATENDGIYKLTSYNNLLTASRIIVEKDSDLTGIKDIYEDSMSNIWLCSYGKGLIKMMHSDSLEFSIKYFNTSDGFIADNVTTIIEDRDGDIWSGNYGKGLTQITPKTFSVYKFDDQLVGNNIFSFWFGRKIRWIGTENGLVEQDELTGKMIKFFSNKNGLPKDTITAIYSCTGEELWIGTARHGLFSMKPGTGKIARYALGDGTLENSITCINELDSQIWVGTKKGLCKIIAGSNNITWYTINQGGLPHNLINGLYIDKSGTIWVTTRSNTLAYIKDGKVNKIVLNSANGSSTLGPITEDSDSRIWVGSNGNGVFMIQSDSVVNLTSKEGLVSNYCYSLICDNNKNLWVGHKAGLSRIRTTDFSIKPIHRFDGLTDNYQFNSNAAFKEQNGKIWFGSLKGYVIYDPSKECILQPPPVLSITSLRINDEEKDYTKKIILPPGKYKIRIDFIGISLKEPALVTYQYRLTGYDQWSEITKNAGISYNHLTEGDYNFILNASSGDSAITELPLTLNIIIKKPVWKQWWFYSAVVTLLVFLTSVYIKRREHKLLMEKRILEEKVKERTSEIQEQKNEIELQRDLINEKNANITSSIKYASHIQNAVLPPGALLDKLFPDNFMLTRPKDIVSGDFYWLAEKNDKIVVTVADCTGHGVPGAFMSLLGVTFLNEIINMQGILKSDSIVTELREKVIHSLKQNRTDVSNSDGMDLVLCVLDTRLKKIQYTGAMNDLVFIRDGKLNVVKADRTSVCVLFNKSDSFTMKEIEYRKGDVFYLYTDGYQDQFGGDFDKKFLTPKFHLTLLEIHKKPMQDQRNILEKKLIDWMGGNDQTDDITVMGIRF
jgi:ligand-binding sensor domain-containing protein/serine phosphatase RsbU (regulator of sigma subunit)